MSNDSHYQITADLAIPQRLDRFLPEAIPDLTRSRVQKLIESGMVAIDGTTCTNKKFLIESGMVIEVDLPPVQSLDLQPQAMALDILYEDEYLILLNKPVGLVVHPAPGHEQDTLVNALLAHCAAYSQTLSGINGVARPGIVHRLDKDTSGVMVVAKDDLTHQHLQEQIQAKTARREYLGIVQGTPPTQIGKIDAPIDRHPLDRKKMAVIETGRPALTHWQIQERLGNYTLVYFRLETGRTHQIRVHCAHKGWPIIGDPLYARQGQGLARDYLPGQALHAWRLRLTHPHTGKTLEAVAPLPPDFAKLLQVLRRKV